MSHHDMDRNVHTYDSVGEYIQEEVDRNQCLAKGGRSGSYDHCGSWDDGVSGKQAAEYARVGKEGHVSEFGNTLADLETLNADVVRPQWMRSLGGSRVVVPEYLADRPDHMRRRTRNENVVRHVNVYVSMVCSAGIHASTMLKRGATILAYLDFLQRSGVNVDLFLVVDLNGNDSAESRARMRTVAQQNGGRSNSYGWSEGNNTQVIRVESRPLNLAQSGFVISHPAFTRNVAYRVGDQWGFTGGFSESYGLSDMGRNQPAYEAIMRERIGMSEHDVFIPPVYLHDTIVEDPKRWLTERAKQLKSAQV